MLFFLLTAVTVAVYLPGLQGEFLFDDFANLPALGAYGPVDNWKTFWLYITSGKADPTGRPIALLSFLLDANNWPAEPLPFKQTSLVFHLFNGFLLWLLIQKLSAESTGAGLTASQQTSNARLVAAISAALWLTHPLLVSTTLYVIQRQTILAATFCLIGLLAWLHGRSHFASGNTAKGATWLVLGIAGCTAFGLACKANAILLPVYVLLLEGILLRHREDMPTSSLRNYKRWMLVLAAIPTTLLLAYLGRVAWTIYDLETLPNRTWSLEQRLLTQPRVLLEYLSLIWSPRPFTTGLFNDQIIASQSLFNPLSTVLSIGAMGAMIVFAFIVRRKWPTVSLSILFFFIAHLLESSVIPLELYYEHRNYMPAMLMFWPLGDWLVRSKHPVWLRVALTSIIFAGLVTMTHQRASLWGNTQEQAILWAEINPQSPRAVAFAAMTEMNQSRYREAEMRLLDASARFPNDIQISLNLITCQCALGPVSSSSLDRAATSLRTMPRLDDLLIRWMEKTIPIAANTQCGLSPEALKDLVDAAMENPKAIGANGFAKDMEYLRGLIFLAQQRGKDAMEAFSRSLNARTTAYDIWRAAALLASSGHAAEGLTILNRYEAAANTSDESLGISMQSLHSWLLGRTHFWQRELERLRTILEAEALD